MKKVILIIVLVSISFSFIDCKKKSKLAQTNSDVYCIWIVNSNGSKTFYKCTSTESVNGGSSEYQNEVIKLREEGKTHEDIKKSDCSECN